MTRDELHQIEQARIRVGAALMELRVLKKRCTDVLTRAETAYMELAGLLDDATSALADIEARGDAG